MENHPIPQDVTGFQFKLIGNMTIKQFAYLATGIVLAWIFLQLPISILLKIPICSFFAFCGFALAFIPVSGRPMDVMIGNFIKALYRPTQFVYEKSGAPLYVVGKTSSPTKQYANNNLTPSQNDKLKAYLKSLNTAPAVNVATPPTQANPAPIQPEPKTEAVAAAQPAPTPTPQPIMPRNIGTPSAPSYPNLLTGVAKGPRGNTLPNILIEVKDKEGNPVRAFKTNEVGRFASATPLANGAYTIEFEDPKAQNKFETKTINVTGQIIEPIIAISIDPREELRRSLFQHG